jgi:Coenzyme PQQ synthesis protein D (PqqD)
MSATSNPRSVGEYISDRTLRLKEGAVAFRVVDGEAVVLDIEHSEYLGMNASATVLLEALSSGATPAELAELLFDRFEVTPETAARDVELFLESCLDEGWLES